MYAAEKAGMATQIRQKQEAPTFIRQHQQAIMRREQHVESVPIAASAVVTPRWPSHEKAYGGIRLQHLAGTTCPQKVSFPEGTFVRKTVPWKPVPMMAETLANHLYQVAGVRVPDCKLYSADMMLCRWLAGLQQVSELDALKMSSVRAQLTKNFVLDAIIANYDVRAFKYGVGESQIATDAGGDVVRIDNGGSLDTDWSGGRKSSNYKCAENVSQRRLTWSRLPYSLWDWQIVEKFSPGFYNNPTAHDMTQQIQDILSQRNSLLSRIEGFQDSVSNGHKLSHVYIKTFNDHLDELKSTLQARIDCLGRIVEKRPDLLDVALISSRDSMDVLPAVICDGVRQVCHDL